MGLSLPNSVARLISAMVQNGMVERWNNGMMEGWEQDFDCLCASHSSSRSVHGGCSTGQDSRARGRGCRVESGGQRGKLQTPSTKLQRNFKLQASNGKA